MRVCVWIVVLLLCTSQSAALDEIIYSFPLDTDPGWSITGDWEFGQPTGQSGSAGHPDPAAAHTGSFVFGNNLDGGYANNITEPEWLTTTALDFAGYTNIQMHFYRWLGVEACESDFVWIEGSIDGINWGLIWRNPPA